MEGAAGLVNLQEHFKCYSGHTLSAREQTGYSTSPVQLLCGYKLEPSKVSELFCSNQIHGVAVIIRVISLGSCG